MKSFRKILTVFIAIILLAVMVGNPFFHNHHETLVDEECPVHQLELFLVLDAFLFEQTNHLKFNVSCFIFNWQNSLEVSKLILGFDNKAPPAAA